MRQPARTKGQRSQVSRTYSLPAPTGGWNTRDNLAAMDAKDAVTMDNWFPLPSEVMLRKGSENHILGFSGPVETLMPYQSGTASKLFAVVDVGLTAEIVDISTKDVDGTPPASSVTGLTNARFEYINFSTSGGSFLLAVNGADKMQYYTGSTWTADGGGTYTVTGVDTATCTHINMHMRRVWLIENNSLKAWYLPVDSIAGAAAMFDFRPLFSRGGYLMAMGTWTLDAGAGMDDHAVFVTSEGEVAVYKGTDPSSVNTWSLVGVYFIGKPIGKRCLVKMGGDLFIICKEGMLPFSRALMSSRVNTRSALTDKIQSTVSEATTLYAANFGWQIVPYPQDNMLILNVPVSATVSHQYVQNTISGAWCRFMDWNALCWTEYNNNLYFGNANSVQLAWTGTSDNGDQINSEVQQAFSYFGRHNLKSWKMARPVLRGNVQPGINLGINVDFDMAAPVGLPSFTIYATGALWDSSTWDGSYWGGSSSVTKDWQSVYGVGYCASLHINTASVASYCTWSATDFLLEDGFVL